VRPSVALGPSVAPGIVLDAWIARVSSGGWGGWHFTMLE